MIVSKLTRKTNIADPAEWDRRAARLLERVRPILERQSGFEDVDLRREGDALLIEETRWTSMDDCSRYVRGGAAATVATIADSLLPTAPYPNGTWARENIEM